MPYLRIVSQFCMLNAQCAKRNRSMATTLIADVPAQASAPDVLEPLDEALQGRLNLAEVGRLAFESLLANKVRALLTMLGVIIGVASVVALLALGNGASNAI